MAKPASHRAVMASRQPTAPDDPDFFPTAPWGGRAGAELILRLDPEAREVWEPACGAGHLVHALSDYFPTVWASDAYHYGQAEVLDFHSPEAGMRRARWVATNPPFIGIDRFIRRAWDVATHGVAILGRSALLESEGRHGLLYGDCPLTVFAPFTDRLPLTQGRWDPDASSAAFYAWFLFLKPALRPERFMTRIDGALRPAIVPIPPGSKARLTRASDAERLAARKRGAA